MIKYLRFDSEAQFKYECEKCGIETDNNGDMIMSTHDYFINPIGVIKVFDGFEIVDGEEVAKHKPLDGFHVNVKPYSFNKFDSYQIFPENPLRG